MFGQTFENKKKVSFPFWRKFLQIILKLLLQHLHLTFNTQTSLKMPFLQLKSLDKPLKQLYHLTVSYLTLMLESLDSRHTLWNLSFRAFCQFLLLWYYILLFVIWKLIWWNKTDLKRNLVVCLITIILFLHPTLTEKSFSLLRCVNIYKIAWLQNDLEIECWKGTHIIWAAGFALPMIVVCFSVPFIGILWMLINKKRLDKAYFKRYFIVVY